MARPHLELTNLVQRHRAYFVRVRVPEDVRHVIGKATLNAPTGERDMVMALAAAQPIIREFKARIARARVGLAMSPNGTPEDTRSMDEVERRAAKAPPPKSTLPLCQHAEDWQTYLAGRAIKPRQVDQMARDLTLFGAKLLLADTTPAKAQEWVYDRNRVGDSPKTVQRRLSALRNYWGFLIDQGVVKPGTEDPFKGLRLPKAPKNGQAPTKRGSFTAAEIGALWSAAEGDKPLQAIIALGGYTGGRLEEIASLTPASVDLEAWTMNLSSKTDAGNRVVPIHGAVKGLIRALVDHAQGGQWLIHSTAKNQYDERGVPLGKRFGRLKTELGYGPDRVFHSLRKSVATMLQDAGCPEPIAADILGHEMETMSYGVYSTGSRMETRREWLEKAVDIPSLSYAPSQQSPDPDSHS